MFSYVHTFQGTRNSPTPDLAIVTQPKKLADKKSEFLRALRSESSLRNGDNVQYQNCIDKHVVGATNILKFIRLRYWSLKALIGHVGGNCWSFFLVSKKKKFVGEYQPLLARNCLSTVTGEICIRISLFKFFFFFNLLFLSNVIKKDITCWYDGPSFWFPRAVI